MSWWAETLRAVRTIEGLTQSELSERAGFAHSQIAEWELDKHEPRLSTFDQLLYVMGYRITIERIKEGEEHD